MPYVCLDITLIATLSLSLSAAPLPHFCASVRDARVAEQQSLAQLRRQELAELENRARLRRERMLEAEREFAEGRLEECDKFISDYRRWPDEITESLFVEYGITTKLTKAHTMLRDRKVLQRIQASVVASAVFANPLTTDSKPRKRWAAAFQKTSEQLYTNVDQQTVSVLRAYLILLGHDTAQVTTMQKIFETLTTPRFFDSLSSAWIPADLPRQRLMNAFESLNGVEWRINRTNRLCKLLHGPLAIKCLSFILMAAASVGADTSECYKEWGMIAAPPQDMPGFFGMDKPTPNLLSPTPGASFVELPMVETPVRCLVRWCQPFGSEKEVDANIVAIDWTGQVRDVVYHFKHSTFCGSAKVLDDDEVERLAELSDTRRKKQLVGRKLNPTEKALRARGKMGILSGLRLNGLLKKNDRDEAGEPDSTQLKATDSGRASLDTEDAIVGIQSAENKEQEPTAGQATIAGSEHPTRAALTEAEANATLSRIPTIEEKKEANDGGEDEMFPESKRRSFEELSTIPAIPSSSATSSAAPTARARNGEPRRKTDALGNAFALPEMQSFSMTARSSDGSTAGQTLRKHVQHKDRYNAEHIDSCETDLWSWSDEYKDLTQREAEGVADRFTKPHFVWTAEGFEIDIHACQPEIFAFGIIVNSPVDSESLLNVARARVELYSADDELLSSCPFDLKSNKDTEFAVALVHRADINPDDIGPFDPSGNERQAAPGMYAETFIRTTLQEYLNHHFASADTDNILAKVGLADFNRLKRKVTAPVSATGCHTQWQFNVVGENVGKTKEHAEQRTFIHALDILNTHIAQTNAISKIPTWGKTKKGTSNRPHTGGLAGSSRRRGSVDGAVRAESGGRPRSARNIGSGKHRPRSAKDRMEGHDRENLTSRQKAVLLNGLLDPFVGITDNGMSLLSVRPIYNPFQMESGDGLAIPRHYSNSDIRVGLGWDTVGGEEADLDVVLLAYAGDKLFAQIDFGNISCGGIFHHGDNRTGDGDGDDESITINLGDLDDAITQLFFCVTMFNGGAFKELEHVCVRIMVTCEMDGTGHAEKEVCRFDTSGIKELSADTKTMLVGHTSNSIAGWTFHAALDGASGLTKSDFHKLVLPYVKASPVLAARTKWKGMKARRLSREETEREPLEGAQLGVPEAPPAPHSNELAQKAKGSAPELRFKSAQ